MQSIRNFFSRGRGGKEGFLIPINHSVGDDLQAARIGQAENHAREERGKTNTLRMLQYVFDIPEVTLHNLEESGRLHLEEDFGVKTVVITCNAASAADLISQYTTVKGNDQFGEDMAKLAQNSPDKYEEDIKRLHGGIVTSPIIIPLIDDIRNRVTDVEGNIWWADKVRIDEIKKRLEMPTALLYFFTNVIRYLPSAVEDDAVNAQAVHDFIDEDDRRSTTTYKIRGKLIAFLLLILSKNIFSNYIKIILKINQKLGK